MLAASIPSRHHARKFLFMSAFCSTSTFIPFSVVCAAEVCILHNYATNQNDTTKTLFPSLSAFFFYCYESLLKARNLGFLHSPSLPFGNRYHWPPNEMATHIYWPRLLIGHRLYRFYTH